MSLLDLFKPRWCHSDPEVRLRTVLAADPSRLPAIALKTLHDDVFQAAVQRIGSDEPLYQVLMALKHLPIPSHLPLEIVRRRQTAIVESIAAWDLLLSIACSFPPPAGMAALVRLDQVSLSRVVAKAGSDEIRQAALERITSQPALLEVALNGPTPAIRMDAIARLTDPGLLLNAVCGPSRRMDASSSGLGIASSLEKRLDQVLDQAAARQDWPAIRSTAAACCDLGRKQRILLKLPGREIELDQFLEIARGSASVASTYGLVKPILRSMANAGWAIQEEAHEALCPSCGGEGFLVHEEIDGERGYDCGTCRGSGKLKTVSVSGRLSGQSFEQLVRD